MGNAMGGKARLILILVMVAFPAFKYVTSCERNPHTGRRAAYAWEPEQGIALGQQAAPKLIEQHQGRLNNPQVQELVKRIGRKLVESSDAKDTPYQFEFTALAHRTMVNAFALPGGQVFITHALLSKLETEGEIAGVIGHEIGHVVARHGAERAAKQQLFQGIAMATVVGGNPNNARVAQMLSGLVNMKFGRDQELESDILGVKYMAESGYDPRALIRVMTVLEDAGKGKGKKPPEFFSTHPSPDRRKERIEEAINLVYPNGVPSNLTK